MIIKGWKVALKDAIGTKGIFITRDQDYQDNISLWFDRGVLFVYGRDMWEGAPYDVFFNIRFFCRDFDHYGWSKVKINAGWYGKHWGWGIPWSHAETKTDNSKVTA